MRTIRQTYRCRSTGDFLHGHHVRHITHAAATVLFTHGHTEQTHVTKLAPQVSRKLIVGIHLCGAWGNFIVGKVLHSIAQHVDVVAQAEVYGLYVHWILSQSRCLFVLLSI